MSASDTRTGRRVFVSGGAALSLSVLVLGIPFVSGCMTDSVRGRRLARYRPSTANRNVALWTGGPGGNGGTAAGPAVQPVSATRPKEEAERPSWSRPLRRGDRIIIYLSGIPIPVERPDIIDDTGKVNLDLIGAIKLEGMTTAEAERAIEKAYVEGGYYKNIAATIVAQEDQYFVKGEVQRRGNYPLRGEVTLLQAITTAGGYTPFAKKRKVQINRKVGGEEKTLMFDAQRIQDGKEKDPLIKPGDVIKVHRTII